MAVFRHYRLFLWKNALQKTRNPGVTCCELLTPIILVALFALLYGSANVTNYPDTTYECSFTSTTGNKYDLAYVPRALNLSVLKLGVVSSEATILQSFTAHLAAHYPGIAGPGASGVLFDDLNCTGLAADAAAQGSLPYFPAFTSDYLMTFASEADLEAYIARSDYGASPSVPGIWAAVVFTQTIPGDWRYRLRHNASDISDTHQQTNDLQRGVLPSAVNAFMYSSAFAYQTAGSAPALAPLYMGGMIPLMTAVDRFIIGVSAADGNGGAWAPEAGDLAAFAADWGCMNPLPLLNTSSRAYAALHQHLRSHALLPQHAAVAPFPTSAYRNDDFYSFVQSVFALVFVLSFFFPSFFLIRGMVVEKETKIREGMRMMGGSDAALFWAWYTTYGLIFLVIAIFIAGITAGTFFGHSDGGLLLLYFLLFGLTAMALCYLLSAFFSKAKLAAAVGAVIFIATFFPYFSVNDPLKATHGAKVAASLLSPVAFGLALDIVSTLESNGVGISWANLYSPVLGGGYSFGAALAMMLFDLVLYTLLGAYLGNVLPQEFGVPLPWYYPCMPRFWRENLCDDGTGRCGFCGIRCGGGNGKRRGNGSGNGNAKGSGFSLNADGSDASLARSGGGDHHLGSSLLGADGAAAHAHRDGGEDDEDGGPGSVGHGLRIAGDWAARFQGVGLATGEHVEPPGPHLRELASEGRCVSVRGLTKTFSTPDGPKNAVDGLDLDLFEGQVTGLLGHNGAGKTTAISMLTGLIPPTAGEAYVYGHSISSGMGAVRHSLGVCPQHDVLWADLTVREHLTFFAGLKGLPAAQVRDAVMHMIREVGLTEKVDTKSAELSGGQKRKLSVGIALIAGSRVVVLDEPTSGMDPWSRRFTWNVIQANKAGRIILLTTHFLEEADILCDRVAIMAAGKPRCVGSALFLKRLFGVGYCLTAVKAPGCDSGALEAIVRRHLHAAAAASPLATAAAPGAAAVAVPVSEQSLAALAAAGAPLYRVLSNVGAEMSFQIPFAASPAFPALFAELEAHLVSEAERARVEAAALAAGGAAAVAPASTAGTGHVALATYGVSVTTLEEVFIRVAEEGHAAAVTPHERADDHKAVAKLERRKSMSEHDRLTGKAAAAVGAAHSVEGDHHDDAGAGTAGGAFFGGSDSYSRAQAVGTRGFFCRHFTALLCKRWRYALRDRRAMLFQLLIPVAALLLGLGLLHQVTTATWPAIPLSIAAYNTELAAPAAPAAAASAAGPSVPVAAGVIAGGPAPHPNFVAFTPGAGSNAALAAAVAQSVASSGITAATIADPTFTQPSGNASFVPVPAEYLAGAYNYSARAAVASTANLTGPCDSYNPGVASLATQAVLASLAYPTFSLNASWALSEYLLDSKNGSVPWVSGGGSGSSTPSSPALIPQSGASRYGAYVLDQLQVRPADGKPFYAAYTAIVNTTASFAAPTFVSAMHSGLYAWTNGGGGPGASNFSISVTNAPLPFTARQGVVINSLLSFFAVLFIVIAFSFIPASFAVFIVKEAEVKAKHQQLISGVSMPAYWLATYTWDCLNYLVPATMAVVLIIAFDVTELVGASLPATILLFLLYGASVAPFTYVMSYAFTSHSTAQIMTLVLNLLCVILLLASFVMQRIEATCPADNALRFAYRLLPGYSLGNGLIQLSLLQELPFLESNCGKLNIVQQVSQSFGPFSLDAAGWPLIYMAAEAVVYFCLAVGIDILLSYPVIRAKLLPDRDVTTEKPYADDEDVAAESRRVDTGAAAGDTIVLRHMRKAYAGGKLAVRDLSFGIPRGEVFGFLGINGAGKTTTLKMLSGDEIPTRGTASLGGFDILSQQIEVRRLLGYCPQFDALLDLLTCREHLELFARIKGVPESLLSGVVEAKLHEMDLTQYSNKLAGSLSGGNKRKLSVAIAMIGDPPLMFLDEPSTGMDPVARRFMWNVISRIATERRQCSIILTTHSMEECEALANRVGIMVGGRLRCLGTTQHLKNKFGRGFLAMVKLAHPSAEKVEQVLEALRPYTYVAHDGVALALAGAAAGAAAGAVAVAAGGVPSAAAAAAGSGPLLKITGSRIREVAEALGDPVRARMLHPNGSGWALAAALAKEGAVDALQFAEWWAAESYGAELHAFVAATFPGSTLSERHGEFFSYSISAVQAGSGAPVRLSRLFELFEAAKARLHIGEYSLSQTSLENIFNSFASQQEEESGPLRGVGGDAGTSTGAGAGGEAAVAAAAAAAVPEWGSSASAGASTAATTPSSAVSPRTASFAVSGPAAGRLHRAGSAASAVSSVVGGSSRDPKRISVTGVEMRAPSEVLLPGAASATSAEDAGYAAYAPPDA